MKNEKEEFRALKVLKSKPIYIKVKIPGYLGHL
jgi:hypothetical protein